jgi:hypothetical protein
MANGERAEQNGHSGREYWSRRPSKFKFPDWGKRIVKRNTHRLERRIGKNECKLPNKAA